MTTLQTHYATYEFVISSKGRSQFYDKTFYQCFCNIGSVIERQSKTKFTRRYLYSVEFMPSRNTEVKEELSGTLDIKREFFALAYHQLRCHRDLKPRPLVDIKG